MPICHCLSSFFTNTTFATQDEKIDFVIFPALNNLSTSSFIALFVYLDWPLFYLWTSLFPGLSFDLCSVSFLVTPVMSDNCKSNTLILPFNSFVNPYLSVFGNPAPIHNPCFGYLSFIVSSFVPTCDGSSTGVVMSAPFTMDISIDVPNGLV